MSFIKSITDNLLYLFWKDDILTLIIVIWINSMIFKTYFSGHFDITDLRELRYIFGILSGTVHTRVEVHRNDLEIGGLVEWSWLQIMCYTVCLLHGHNFRWWKEVWDGSECWLVCCHWTLEIEFNKRLYLLIIRLANYSVTTSLIYKQKV